MKRLFVRTVLTSLWMVAALVARGATFTPISPITYGPGGSGSHQLQITGLPAGDTVLVEKFLDLNGNGLIDPAVDWMVGSFTVTDGQVPTIGGVRNINRPGDEDGIAGTITINLALYSDSEVNRLAGSSVKYIYRVTPSSGVALVQTLTVSQALSGGSVSGTVSGGGPAVVVALSTAGSDQNFVAGTVTTSGGAYNLFLPPGSYKVVAVKKGFVDNATTAPTTVVATTSVARNPVPVAATRTINGLVVDHDSGVGLPGVALFCDNTNGMFAVTTTDTNGAFSVSVAAGVWRINASDASLTRLGYIGLQNSDHEAADLTALTSASRIIEVKMGTAMFYGTVRDGFDTAVTFVEMEGHNHPGDDLSGRAFTDAFGNYCLLAIGNGDAWHFRGEPESFAARSLLAPSTNNIYVTDGMATQLDFVAPTPNAFVRGRLLDNLGNGVAGVRLRASLNSEQNESSALTATDGSFALGLIGGYWYISTDNQDALAAAGLIPPSISVPMADDQIRDPFNIVAPRAALTITGKLANSGGSPLPGVQVMAYIYTFSADFSIYTNYQVQATTDQAGNYRLGVFNAAVPWNVNVDSDGLQRQGYFSEFFTNILMGGLSKVANFTASVPSYTPSPWDFGVAKGRGFQQLTAGAATALPDKPFIFTAFSDNVPAGSVMVRPPLGPVRWLVNDYNSFDVEEIYSALTDLNISAPNGTYTFTFNTYSNGQKSATLSLTGDALPPAAHILGFNALQQVHANTFTVQWDAFPGGSSTDSIEVRIEDDQGDDVFATANVGAPDSLDGTATSVQVTGNLIPGKVYSGRIIFAKIVSTTTVAGLDGSGFAAYFSETRFPIQAVYQPDAQTVGFFKGEAYRQSGTSAPVLASIDPYRFVAFADEPGQNSVPNLTSVQLQTPVPDTFSVPTSPNPTSGVEWLLSETYSASVFLEAARPNGSYLFTTMGPKDGTKNVTLNLTGNNYPPVPKIDDLDTLQQLNPADGFYVSWDSLAGGTTNDLIVLKILNASGEEVFSTPQDRTALDAMIGSDNPTFAFIPPFTLLAGQTYRAVLRFERVTALNTIDYPGATGYAGYFRETAAQIRTAVSPNLFPIVNSQQNERAGGFDFDGQNYLVGLNVNGVSNAVQFVSASGDPLGDPILVGSGSQAPVVAYDGTNYLVAWVDDGGVRGETTTAIEGLFVSTFGFAIGGPFPITTAGQNQVLQSVVFGAGRYLLVWQQSSAVTGQDILGVFVDAAAVGNRVGLGLPGQPGPLGGEPDLGNIIIPAPFTIAGSALAEVDAAAVFNGDNFFVAYQSPLDNSANTFHVFGRLINPSGSLSNVVQVSQVASPRHNPLAVAVGSSGDLVVWSRDISSGAPASPAWDLYGRVVTFTGQPSGNEFIVSAAAGDQSAPSAAFDGNTFLVGWIDTDPNDRFGVNNRARGRFFNASGTGIGAPFVLFEDIFGRPPATVGLAFNHGNFLAFATYAYANNVGGYFGGDVFGSFVSPVSPGIYAQPRSQNIVVGGPVTFTVGASGVETLFYQWRKNGTAIPNETNSSLVLSFTSSGSSGNYSVVVSNQFGVAVSANAVLRALAPPLITTFPQPQVGSLGGTATFTVFALGDAPFLYQWSRNGRVIPGETNTSLVLTNLQPRDLGTYNVTVENLVAAIDTPPVKLTISGLDLAFNDTFASRGSTNSMQGIGTASNTNATKETGEPNHAGRRGGKSVWYSWIAPASGVAAFSTEGSTFDTVIGVYTGLVVNALSPVASDDDGAGFGTSLVRFNATIGQEYLIAVDGYDGASGDIVLSWILRTGIPPVAEIVQQPANQSLPLGTNATFVVVARSPGVLAYQWYFNDTLLSGETADSLVVSGITAENAGSYYVVVSSGGDAITSAAAYLEISSTGGVNSEDKFADTLLDSSGNPIQSNRKKGTFASVSAGVVGTQILDNFGSGKELGEPNHAGITGGASRWFSIQPTSDGVLVVDTIGSDIDTVLAVYTGNSLFTLTLVATDNDGAPDGIRSLVRFNATAGTFYRVAVDSVNGVQGHINLNWALGNPPVITASPDTPQVVTVGTNLTLTGAASGTPDPKFQWRFNGSDISGATNSVLTVNNFQTLNGGTYSLLASNFAGAVSASAIITLNVSNDPPRVSIVSPGSNAVFNAGANITISASASDFTDGPVDHVEFYRGSVKIGQKSSPPYSVTFSNAPLTNYILTARAVDYYGVTNISLDVPIRVIVADKIKPTVTVNTPLANARLSNAVVNLTGKSSDNVLIASVEARLNNGAFASLPGTTNWTNSFTLVPGTNTFRIRATDLVGNISATNLRTVIYVVTNSIALAADGAGTIAGLTNQQVVEVGRGYKLTATPKAGNLFSNWTAGGSVFSTNPALNFLMSSNLDLTAHFVTNPFVLAKGIYNGLFMDTNNVAFTNAGLINLTVTDKGVFSGKLLLAGASHLLTGGFQVDGTAKLKVIRTGKPTLTNQLVLDLVTKESLGGTVSDGAFVAAIQGEKAVFATTNKSPYEGKYTLIVPGTLDVTGDGSGTVTNNAAGTLTFAGTLADGTVLSQSVPVSRSGWWPLYVPLYTGKGMFISWAQIDTNGTRTITGDAVWTKLAQPGKYYTNGLVVKTSVDGGGYLPPAVGPTNLVLATTNGMLVLTGGNLAASITNSVVLTNNNVLIVTGTNSLKLTITPSSGLVSGTFTHPQSKLVTKVTAVVQQAKTNIDGAFLGTNVSGTILLQPQP